MKEYNLKLEKFLFPLISKIKKPMILEFGVHAGISTKRFIKICSKNKGHLYSVDVVDYKKLSNSPRWTFFNCRDDNLKFLRKKIPNKFDVIYLDSFHEAEHVKKIIFQYFGLLKVGGYFFIDDISHLPYLKNEKRESFYCEINNQETFQKILEIYNQNQDAFDLDMNFKSSGLCIIKKLKNKNLKNSKKILSRKNSLKNFVRIIWRKIRKN